MVFTYFIHKLCYTYGENNASVFLYILSTQAAFSVARHKNMANAKQTFFWSHSLTFVSTPCATVTVSKLIRLVQFT